MEINLVRKDRSVIRKVAQLRRVSVWVTILTIGGFLLQIIFLTGRMTYLSWKDSNLDTEIATLKATLKGRDDEMERYDEVKRRLDFILEEQDGSYKYTAYLSEISGWLFPRSSLAAISFVNKEDIAFTLKAEDTEVYRDLEERLVNLDFKNSKSLFTGLRQETLSRKSSGEYLLRIIGRIR